MAEITGEELGGTQATSAPLCFDKKSPRHKLDAVKMAHCITRDVAVEVAAVNLTRKLDAACALYAQQNALYFFCNFMFHKMVSVVDRSGPETLLRQEPFLYCVLFCSVFFFFFWGGLLYCSL